MMTGDFLEMRNMPENIQELILMNSGCVNHRPLAACIFAIQGDFLENCRTYSKCRRLELLTFV